MLDRVRTIESLGAVARRAAIRQQAAVAHVRASCTAAVLQFDCAPGVSFERGVTVNLDPGASLSIGAGTHLARGAYLHVAAGGHLSIGPGCFIGHGCIIMSKDEVTIGHGAAIAEYVSIRDHDHIPGVPPATGGLHVAPVHIDDDVWLGSKSVVTRGCSIGQGAVVAAGAVVTRDVPADTLVAGVPARLLKVLK